MDTIDSVTWEQFQKQFRWAQGEHVAVMAPTGAGKTTLISEILERRKYVIFLGTKKEDKQYTKLIRNGYRRISSVADITPLDTKVLLWPHHRATIPETIAVQTATFVRAFNYVARTGKWCVVCDEAKYMTDILKLGSYITFLQEQMRSAKGTNVSGAQRPFWLPRSVLSSATHVFLWKTTDQDDMKRLSDIGGVDKNLVRKTMMQLDKHEFIYIHTRGTEARMVRSQVRR